MKKLSIIILSILLAFTLSSCGGNQAVNNTVTPTPTNNIAPSPTPLKSDQLSLNNGIVFGVPYYQGDDGVIKADLMGIKADNEYIDEFYSLTVSGTSIDDMINNGNLTDTLTNADLDIIGSLTEWKAYLIYGKDIYQGSLKQIDISYSEGIPEVYIQAHSSFKDEITFKNKVDGILDDRANRPLIIFSKNDLDLKLSEHMPDSDTVKQQIAKNSFNAPDEKDEYKEALLTAFTIGNDEYFVLTHICGHTEAYTLSRLNEKACIELYYSEP